VTEQRQREERERLEAEARQKEEKERLEAEQREKKPLANRNQSERNLVPLAPNTATKFQRSTKAGEKEGVASAIVPPSPAPSQGGGPAQAEPPPIVESPAPAKETPSALVTSLVVLALISIVGLIWFPGSKLNYRGREAALVTPTSLSSKPAPFFKF
jgi:hypothetical protein